MPRLMRIKIDEDLPLALIDELSALGHEVDHVKTSNLAGRKDPDVWSVARREDRLLITQDVKFTDARVLEVGPHPGFILLRLTQGYVSILQRVVEVFETYPVETWRGCIVVIDDKKVRVRRPPA
jgi:predicted nuclease of predicted toxin-antitoxin system